MNELKTFQRYFRLVNKGLVDDPFTCICGYELALLPKKKSGEYYAFFVCHMCQREYLPGTEHHRIATLAIKELEGI